MDRATDGRLYMPDRKGETKSIIISVKGGHVLDHGGWLTRFLSAQSDCPPLTPPAPVQMAWQHAAPAAARRGW